MALMDQNQNNYIKFSGAEGLMPKEEMLEVQRQKSSMIIGVPREVSPQERRVGLVPEAVNGLNGQFQKKSAVVGPMQNPGLANLRPPVDCSRNLGRMDNRLVSARQGG